MPYVHKSRHGVFRYRRVIPEPLRPRAGKREILVSLDTKDEREAELRVLRVHAEAEALLSAWRFQDRDKLPTTSNGQKDGAKGYALAAVVDAERCAIDDWFRGKDFLNAHGLIYYLYKQGMPDHEFDIRDKLCVQHFGIDTSDTDTRDEELDRSPEARALIGILEKPNPTLDEALKVYLRLQEGKTAGLGTVAKRKWDNEKRRVIAYLVEAVGPDHTVTSLSRSEVRSFEQHLRARCQSAGSIRKLFRLARAIVEKNLQEFDIQRRNPFCGYTGSDPTPEHHKRLPLSNEEFEKVPNLSVNAELAGIARLLADTGARLGEIVGLSWADVRSLDGDRPFLEIRPNAIRGLKTKASIRVVPLLPTAATALREQRQRLQDASGRPAEADPVFPTDGRTALTRPQEPL